MPAPWNQPGDQVLALEPYEYIVNDVFEALRRPWVHSFWELDVSAALAFVQERTTPSGEKLTLTPLFIRALALALRDYPCMNRLYRGRKVIQPGSVDIGISVAVETMHLAPVVIVKEAERKTIDAIAEELRVMAAEAREKEKKTIEDMNKLGRLFPFSGLRKLIMRWFVRRDWVARGMSGTWQVSNWGGVGVEWAGTPVTAVQLLGIGKARRRAVVVGDRVEIRPISILTMHTDHRNADGRVFGLFVKAFLGYLTEPERLLGD